MAWITGRITEVMGDSQVTMGSPTNLCHGPRRLDVDWMGEIMKKDVPGPDLILTVLWNLDHSFGDNFVRAQIKVEYTTWMFLARFEHSWLVACDPQEYIMNDHS